MNDWTKQAIFYHIYPLGFCGCEQYHQDAITHRIHKLKDWIPHFKQLHVNALYLGPIFNSFEHGYDTSDYRVLDHRLGTNEDFINVCDTLHENGIRIVLDGVFNHVGRDFWAFKDVQQNKESSPYCNWFSNLNFHCSNPMGDSFTYDTWQGHYNLVKLNLYNEEVIQYLLDCVNFWIDTFGIDGLRLDAADCIPFSFFQRLRQFCKTKKEDFWLMGEIIHGDYNRWANDEMLDSVTNYECYKGLYSSHNTKNYFEIAYSFNRQFGNGGIYKNITLYNFVDNHDVNRLASTLNNKKDLFNTYTMLYTMPGIPSIYYGSEYGLEGVKTNGSDAALRPCIELDLHNQNQKLTQHIARLGLFKQSLPVLSFGDYQQIYLTNEQFVFKRTFSQQSFYAVFNTAEHDIEISFTCKEHTLKNLWDEATYSPVNDTLTLFIPSKSSLLLINDEHICLQDTKNICNETISPETSVPIGLYEHFKGKQYRVLHIAKHSETEEPYVVYQQMYGNKEIWIRPLSMFIETIEKNNEKVPRFKYIGK